MNNTKHTPGPWQLDISPSGFAHIFSEKELVGTIGHIDMVKVKANATLIAAAPAMYEALKGMLEWARRVKQNNPGPEVMDALNAIARAEGRQ